MYQRKGLRGNVSAFGAPCFSRSRRDDFVSNIHNLRETTAEAEGKGEKSVSFFHDRLGNITLCCHEILQKAVRRILYKNIILD